MNLRARIVVPVARPAIEDGAVCLEGGRIAWVGRHADMPASYAGPWRDLGEVILLPGLINAHCHLDYTDMAGQLTPPRHFVDWIKALVALGPEGVIKDTVAGALWPDSEGDAARDAFEVTLHRLRKLLGRDEAVQLTHGMLQVNRALVWVDSSAFERLAAEANGEHGALNVAAAEGALTLYGGPFLQNEEDTPWLLPARERLRSRYIRLAIRTAQHF